MSWFKTARIIVFRKDKRLRRPAVEADKLTSRLLTVVLLWEQLI
jgi:hypothetical protein